MITTIPSAPRTLLLVEDEVPLSNILAEMLRDAGYDVVVANSANEAVDLLRTGATNFAAILSDIRLGGDGSGWDVVNFAYHRADTIGMIYLSGDSGHEWAEHGMPGSLFLQKPFSGATLLAAIASVLRR